MKRNLSLSVEMTPPRSDVSFLVEKLMDHNSRIVGDRTITPVSVFIRDERGVAVGGLVGEVYWGWFSIETMWVNDEFRYQGYGSMLLRAAEDEARRHNCRHSRTDTFSFQALPFYQKHGYHVFGQLEDMPAGHTRYFLHKKLDNAEESF